MSFYYKIDRNGATYGFNSFTGYYSSTTGNMIYNGSQVSGTAGQAGIVSTNNASAFIGFDAEL